MLAIVSEIEAQRHVSFALGSRASASVGMVDPAVAAQLQAAAQGLGLPDTMMGSPASHEATDVEGAIALVGKLTLRRASGTVARYRSSTRFPRYVR
ncbi:hypothetical protein [Bosea sp. 685]|uniref:hypothetical protein n=1 Tax=Bosea sp. 685 TaxID=3080057 RepID=UPI00289375D9|nr:hypothetical protein [Bosea sp. 685]WNJ91780.1 hypothetical protein RMR04_05595 [Bosea sp. 685]